MGSFVGLLIGVVIWIIVGVYAQDMVMKAVCVAAITYLVYIYLVSLKKKKGSAP